MTTDTQKRQTIEYKWQLPWQEMSGVLSTTGSFSLRNLNIHNSLNAHLFSDSCGFNPQNSSHLREFNRHYFTAIHYIRHILLTEEERRIVAIPDCLLRGLPPSQLLQWASNLSPRKRILRLWACALLKVTNAIVNLEYSGRISEIDTARNQIFSKIKSLLNLDSLTVKDSKYDIQLLNIDWKEAKTRQSIITKILHKPDAVADDVFDYIGVRFVVKLKSDIPRIMRFLIESNVVIPHQVIPSRTRNNLMNLDDSQVLHALGQDLLDYGTLTSEEFDDYCRNIPWGNFQGDSMTKNSFSSKSYRSIQVTVKHLVRTPNPNFLAIQSLTAQLARYRAIDFNSEGHDHLVSKDIVRYFPIEIQIMDESSYDLSKFGPASHEKYKSAQLVAVREKIVGRILKYNSTME